MGTPSKRNPSGIYDSRPREQGPPNAQAASQVSRTSSPGGTPQGGVGHGLGQSLPVGSDNPGAPAGRKTRARRRVSKTSQRVYLEYLRHDPKEQSYRFMWLKRVWKVDLQMHCQPALLGPTSLIVRTRRFWQAPSAFEIKDVYLEPSDSGFFYLCGVTHPYIWARNFHLPFCFASGQTAEKRWFGIHVLLRDAIELPLSETYIDLRFPRFSERRYRTCRNAQFAWGFSKGLYLPTDRPLAEPLDPKNNTGSLPLFPEGF